MTATDSTELRRLRKALLVLSDAGGEAFSVVQAGMLIQVALHEGTSLKELAEMANVEQSTTTRTIDILGAYGRKSKKGMHMVERREVPGDRRLRGVFLTPKGRRFCEELARIR